MSFNSQFVTLSELCTDISYGYTASAINEPLGPKFLRITDIQGGVVNWDDVPYCEAKQSAILKNKLEYGDIVIARTGNSTGENYFFEGSEESVFASYLIRFRVDPKLANPYFVWLQLRTQNWWDFVSGSKSGSAQAGANAKVLGRFELKLPERAVQDQVEKIIRGINAKLRLNSAINQTLEQMAQAIFKSWFVDFEPVKAKIAALAAGGNEEYALLAAMQAISGKDSDQLATMQADQPEQYAELRATAELFPSAMQESELGEIPEGWNSGTLNDIGDFPNDRISTNELTLSSYVSTENMLENKRGIVNASSVSTSQTVPKYVAGHILVSNIRPYFKKIWLADSEGGRSPDVLGFEGKSNTSPEFLYNVLYQDKFFEYMMLTSKGAKMPRGDKKAIMGFTLTIPPVALSELFSTRVKSFYLLRKQYEQQIQTLECLRDTLLPKLLSGDLNIDDEAQSSGIYKNDGESGLTALIKEIESDLPSKSHFIGREKVSSEFENIRAIEFMTKITGSLGEGGGEYLKLPVFLRTLRQNPILDKVLSATVDGVVSIPFFMDAIIAVLNKYLGNKIQFDQKTALVLLAFPKETYRKTSELLNKAYQLSTNAGLPPIDEDELHQTLSWLHEQGLVLPENRNEAWRLVDKFRHEIDNWG